MKNIVLTGFMGTGKTEVGKILAKKLGFVFMDIDQFIEKEQGMSVSRIFEERGENGFRELEAKAVRKVSEMRNVVISTGGGAMLREENIENLKNSGILVCLSASPEVVFRRIGASKNRPLLQVTDPLQKIKDLMGFRRRYYEKSDIIIETDNMTPLLAAEEIISALPHLNDVHAGDKNGKC